MSVGFVKESVGCVQSVVVAERQVYIVADSLKS